MKRVVIGYEFLALILIVLLFMKCNGPTSPQTKDFKDLDLVDRTVMQYDSVYGDYRQWSGIQDLGTGDPKSITRALVLDRSNKFAIKASFEDKSGFFTKIPGDINFSGQWTETKEKLTLKFYFPPVTWYELFDSLKNEKGIEFIDSETIELDKSVDPIWIMGTECRKIK